MFRKLFSWVFSFSVGLVLVSCYDNVFVAGLPANDCSSREYVDSIEVIQDARVVELVGQDMRDRIDNAIKLAINNSCLVPDKNMADKNDSKKVEISYKADVVEKKDEGVFKDTYEKNYKITVSTKMTREYFEAETNRRIKSSRIDDKIIDYKVGSSQYIGIIRTGGNVDLNEVSVLVQKSAQDSLSSVFSQDAR